MAQLQCVYTCWMPNAEGKLELFEDWFGDARDVYEVPEDKVEQYLATGSFVELG